MDYRVGHSDGTRESFRDTAFGGNTIVFGSQNQKRAVGLTLGGLFAIICLWLFLYISGIFPYLGHQTRSESYGLGASRGSESSTFSLKKMLLFKGQRAFIEYDVRSGTGGGVYLDIKRWPNPNFTDRMMRVKGAASGRHEVIIEETGMYEFYHGFEIGSPSTTTHYSVTWGAT